MNYWVLIYRFAWGILLLLLVLGILFVFLPQCNRLRTLEQKREALETENRELDAMSRNLRDKQQQFDTNPAFVVRTARESGMIMPHETVYKITNSEARAESLPAPALQGALEP
jgi:cell division protein FtsB